jgi:hypothetical protein
VAWETSDAKPHRENEIVFSPLPARGERERLDLPERRGFNPAHIKRAENAPKAAKGARA